VRSVASAVSSTCRCGPAVRGLFCARAALAALALWALAGPAPAQRDLEEPLLPEEISEKDVEMRGRYARQWKQEDGTLVVLFTGGFRLDMGQRRLSAHNAVVWIEPKATAEGRKYYELTVYLSDNAQVQEFGGTTIEDRMLLVSNLRTFGRIIKYHDAHAPEPGESSPLYRQALRDRALIEAGPPAVPAPAVAVARPPEVQPPAPRELPPRVIHYDLPSVEPAETPEGLTVLVAARTHDRRVYFSREGGPEAPMLEILADNAVVFPAPGFAAGLLGGQAKKETPAGEPAPSQPSPMQPPAQGPGLELPGLERAIHGVYLEGDVLLVLGTSFVRADRLYYDFERDRAIILDAVFRADLPERGIPLYIRADEIRQLSAREFLADHARVTTSEFHTPHYHVGVEHIRLRDTTVRDSAGRAVSKVRGQYELKNATFNVANWPLLWWPYARGDYEVSETALKHFRTSYSSRFGFEIETKWHPFNLLGMSAPEGYDATWRLDYFSKRGPATGIDLDYQRPDHFGLLRSYYIHDDGEDTLGPLRKSEEIPDTTERGRLLWRHRHYLPDNWEVTFELSYISDPNFLEEYERAEFNEGKEQETAIYLKRTGTNDAITLLANWRLLDFVTQTEHLPELSYRRLGDTFLSPLVMYHESHIGTVRYRPDDRRFFDERTFSNDGLTDVTFRADARQEIELPLKLGPVKLAPFATFRGSYWDGTPRRNGGLWRGMGTYGVRGGTVLSRVFEELESELFDIHQIRHVIRPEFAAWWSHSNARSELLTPFDYGIETIDDFYGFTAALKQTWQTKRGPPESRRTVDLLAFNLEAGFFGDTEGRNQKSNGWADPIRPENSRTRNYFAGDLIYRLSDTTSLLYEFNLDLNDMRLDRNNVSLAVERNPRLAYVFGYRYAGDIDMNLIGGGWNYKLTEKHITTVRAWFDLDRGDLGEATLAYVRRLPRWYCAVAFEYDRIDDDFSISLSIWPEGIPEWTIGSRRFTGLSTGTGIRP
jgi:hypothetical protein